MVGGPCDPPKERVLSEQIAVDVANIPSPATSLEDGVGALESTKLLSLILDSLDSDGATDIVTIPLSGKSSEADSMVIATGRSTRHVSAIAEKLMDRLKHEGHATPRAEGKDAADWVLIDAGDVIAHIFRPDVRDFYQLEKMWMTAPDATARETAR